MSITYFVRCLSLVAIGLIGLEIRGNTQEQGDHCDETFERAKALRKQAATNNLRDRNSKVQLAHSAVLESSEIFIRDYDKVGQTWMRVLDDENAPNSCRCMAALVLGEMRYVPSIPLLVKHVRLVDNSIVGVSDGVEPRIVVFSLAKFETAVVPAVVEACLAEQDQSERFFLIDVLRFGKAQKAAVIYLTGLRAKEDSRVTDQKFDEFVERFDPKDR